MNKIIIGSLAVVITIGTFAVNMVGCSNDSDESKKVEQISFQKRGVSTERMLNDDQVEMVAEKHNEYLTSVFANYNFQTKDRVVEFQARFESLDLKNYKIDWTEKDYGNIENELLFLKENLSNNAFLIIEKAVEKSKSFECFDEYIAYLNSLELEAREKLIGTELDAILISLNVFENSSMFWLPVDEGGLGIGYDFIEEYNNAYNKETSSVRQTIKTALAADGISAAAGFIIGAGVLAVTTASGGMATPAVVAFLVGIAAESAVASAVAIGIDIS